MHDALHCIMNKTKNKNNTLVLFIEYAISPPPPPPLSALFFMPAAHCNLHFLLDILKVAHCIFTQTNNVIMQTYGSRLVESIIKGCSNL